MLYFVFDVMVLAGRDLMREPLEMRRELLEKRILPKLGEPVRYAGPLDASLAVLIESVKAQGLEGLVAKRLDSRYESGLRSGAWQKMRVNRGQEFVIGGYTVGTKTFDALSSDTTRATVGFTQHALETDLRRSSGSSCSRNSVGWKSRIARS